jgi:hypothetical protein
LYYSFWSFPGVFFHIKKIYIISNSIVYIPERLSGSGMINQFLSQ